MGQVYRAKDTKLHRDVARKVLPEQFAQLPDRQRARSGPSGAQLRQQLERPAQRHGGKVAPVEGRNRLGL